MPFKRPRSGLTGSSFEAYLVFLDRCTGMRTDWNSYRKLIPEEAAEYAHWIEKIQCTLTENRYRTPSHRAQLEVLLRRYRTELSVLAQDFWETHSLYSLN